MKIIIVSLALLLSVMQSFAQSDYLQQSERQKKIAWTLLGGGGATIALATGLTFVSFIGDVQDGGNTSKGSTIGNILSVAGVTAVVASIPFFIGAGKNRRRAAGLSFTNQRMLSTKRNEFVVKIQPALSLRITL